MKKISTFLTSVWWRVCRVPFVTTTYGVDRVDRLDRLSGKEEDERAVAEWVEYRKEGELVHRSVHVTFKNGLFFQPSPGDFCG